MKRSYVASLFAMLISAFVFAGCSGGGASATSGAAACVQGQPGASGTVYPANVVFSIPFSSATVSGTFDFAAVNFCTQAPDAVGTSTPSSAVPSLAGLLPDGQRVLTFINLRINGEAYPNAPTTIHMTLPAAEVGKTIYVYNYYSSTTGWRYNYSAVATQTSLVLSAQYPGNDFNFGDNSVAIVSN